MLYNRLRGSFPHQYEILEYGECFAIQAERIATFYDVNHVVLLLSDCLNDLFDMRLMAEMLIKYDMFDPITCWQDVHVLHRFAILVFSGRIALRKVEPEKPLFTRVQRGTAVEEEVAAPEPSEQPNSDAAEIVIILEDEEGNPVPGQKYELQLADGKILRGVTNRYGTIEKKRIPAGTCELILPKLDEEAWDHA